MATKALTILLLFMAAVVLISSDVAARDLAEQHTDHATESSKGTDQYGGYGGRGGYGGYGGRVGYGGYGGRRGGYGGYGGRGGYGGYRGGYGGGRRCGGFGCCGGGYYGGGCRCCTFAGEKPDAGYQP